MQSFIIFYRFFLAYIIGISTKTYTKDRVLAVLGIVVNFTNNFIGWFDLAKTF